MSSPVERREPVLGDEDALLRDFGALLRREQHALAHGDAAAVEALCLDKTALLARLSAMDWRANAGGMQRAAVVAQLRQLNEENGRLLAWRLGRMNDRLAALGAPGTEANLYNAAGYARARFTRAPNATAYD